MILVKAVRPHFSVKKPLSLSAFPVHAWQNGQTRKKRRTPKLKPGLDASWPLITASLPEGVTKRYSMRTVIYLGHEKSDTQSSCNFIIRPSIVPRRTPQLQTRTLSYLFSRKKATRYESGMGFQSRRSHRDVGPVTTTVTGVTSGGGEHTCPGLTRCVILLPAIMGAD